MCSLWAGREKLLPQLSTGGKGKSWESCMGLQAFMVGERAVPCTHALLRKELTMCFHSTKEIFPTMFFHCFDLINFKILKIKGSVLNTEMKTLLERVPGGVSRKDYCAKTRRLPWFFLIYRIF